METWVIEKIAAINQEFYQKFARSFAVTRYRVQPGVARLVENIPVLGNWLDIGCGNGTLALAFIEKSRQGRYFGCDLSPALIREAEKKLARTHNPEGLSIDFKAVDINQHDWRAVLPDVSWIGSPCLQFFIISPQVWHAESCVSSSGNYCRPGNRCLFLSGKSRTASGCCSVRNPGIWSV